MRLILLLALAFSITTCYAQVENHIVEPVGKYKNIDMSKDTKMFLLLMDTTNAVDNKLVDSTIKNANYYTPPVLYALSYKLFHLDKKSEASCWFYIAQLRARYDVNRCTDATSSATQYNEFFGPEINKYAFTNLDTLEKIVIKSVNYVKVNEEKYDPRWINLTGMKAMLTSLGNSKGAPNELTKPKQQWTSIKTETISSYFNEFKEYLISIRKEKSGSTH
jgi:hypothetical protein